MDFLYALGASFRTTTRVIEALIVTAFARPSRAEKNAAQSLVVCFPICVVPLELV